MFLKPDSVKSCSYCKLKKIKCSADLPSCAKCTKLDLECDMLDNIYYNYETVQSLLGAIDKLENQIGTVKQTKTRRSSGNEGKNQDWSVKAKIFQPLVSPALEKKVVENSPDALSANSSSADKEEASSKGKHKPKKDTKIEDLSTEVGSMTLSDHSNKQGNEARNSIGASFAKLFLKQLNLGKNRASPDMDEFEQFDASVTTTYAPLPPYRISKYAVYKYINSVHIYCPIVVLSELKTILDKMYTSPKDVTLHEKYLLFMVISIGLDRSEKDAELVNYNNQFSPVDYFNTAYNYLETILHTRSESSLQAILLVIIWTIKANSLYDDNEDLWHLGRFALSLGMELGVHRFNPEWDFGETKNELRNRLFWGTYILERSIAVRLGRGLSLRKQAIDTPLPKLLKDDYLAEISLFESEDLKVYDRVQFKPCLFMINICEAYGDILEMIYTTRTKGIAPSLSMEEIMDFKVQMQNSLDDWMSQVDIEIPSNLDCYYELKTKYCIASIILNRPSPYFPKPDVNSVMKCRSESESCVECYNKLLERGWKITPQCKQDIVNAGLTFIYCCWQVDNNSAKLKDFALKALNIMNEILRYYPDFSKFKNLFIIVSSVIIDGFDKLNSISPSQLTMSNSDFLMKHVPQQLQHLEHSLHSPSSTPFSNHLDSNVIEFNDWFTQELFQDVFRQYYHQDNNLILQELDRLFNFRCVGAPN